MALSELKRSTHMSKRVPLEMSEAEALLLLEGLSKLEEKNVLDSIISEEERNAFWALEAVLEKKLPVFSPDYAELVEAARKELKGDG